MLLQSDWTMDNILETSIHVLRCYVQYAIDFFTLFRYVALHECFGWLMFLIIDSVETQITLTGYGPRLRYFYCLHDVDLLPKLVCRRRRVLV